MTQSPTKIGIFERGMWTHVNNLDDPDLMRSFRRKLDEDSQAEAPLYGLGKLTFFEEKISDPIPTMPPTYVAILRRYKGPIVDPVKAAASTNAARRRNRPSNKIALEHDASRDI